MGVHQKMTKSAQEIRIRLQKDVTLYGRSGEAVTSLSDGQKGAIIGEMNRILGGDQNRRVFLGWVFRGLGKPLSTKLLKTSHWWALAKWVGLYHDDDGWRASPDFQREAVRVMDAALKSYFRLHPGLELEQMALDAPETAYVASELGGVVVEVAPLPEQDKEESDDQDVL
jgi:hypothetical protein